MRYTLIAIFACIAASCSTIPTAAHPTSDTLSASAIKAHMGFLADDALEGREAGMRGEKIAGLYIASVFESLSIEPGGEDGTYIQDVPLLSATVDLDKTIFKIEHEGRTTVFQNGVDVAIFGDATKLIVDIESEVIFVGHGITAPELGIDDYAGLDTTGKIVAVLGGPPAFLPAAEGAHFGTTAEKRKIAIGHGATGLITIYTPAQEKRFPFENIRSFLETPSLELRTSSDDGQTGVLDIPSMFVNPKAAAVLFAGLDVKLETLIDQGQTEPIEGFPLATRASVHIVTRHDESLVSGNVGGILRGSDPTRADEFVVVTAHYDHVGICRPEGTEDRICNGAIDNAFGVAAMLDVARQLSQSDTPPARSILFLAVGAEEKGLLGSEFFVRYPTVPADEIIANINMDGGLPYYHFSDVIAFGAEQSEMGRLLADAIAPIGLTVSPDPFPEESIFTRSDQYSFVKQGIPALFLYNGFTNLDGENVGQAIWDETISKNYHTPTDDLSLPIDYDVAAKYTEVFRRLLIEVADAPARPLWYEDSIFGKRFALEASKAQRLKLASELPLGAAASSDGKPSDD